MNGRTLFLDNVFCRRKILRDENCLSLLLSQLRSPSLTIVSNACGTLWNFSARSQTDQELLWELGAVPMLQSLTNSKHKTISTCSLAALKNLYTARPSGLYMMVSGAGQTGQLTARKVKNMVADLDEKLSDCGGKDVEGGSPSDTPDGSDNDLSGSEAEDKDGGAQGRADSQASVSSGHSRQSQARSSRSPDGAGGRKALFLKGIADVAKQNGTSMESLGKSLPSCYSQSISSSKASQSPTSPPQPSRRDDPTRSSLSAEGRFDSHYTSFMKKPSPEFKVPSLDLYLEKDKERSERVLSPSHLVTAGHSQDSPSSKPLDLSTKSKKYEEQDSEDVEPCDDKPTDYSLRYQETEEADKETKAEPLFDDAVRTYYTEGTPMDTPFMFSTATSMNDLRESAIAEEDEKHEEKDAAVVADTTVAYAVEGTPGVFSRAESLSDLEDIDDMDNKLTSIPETKEEKAMTETAGEKRESVSKTPPLPAAKDTTKTVTFSGAGLETGHSVRNPHETPMMFSRASSIASLDSFDQQSVNDDYSSYEASRATSGRVSPSHLPDSPSQTMPGTPRQPRLEKEVTKKSSGPPPLAALHKKPMFDDGMRSYQVEGTPAILSTRTSLSGLEFEEEEIHLDAGDVKDKSSNNSNISDDEDIYADSESLLGQLINSAMPNSKSSKSKLPKPKHKSKIVSEASKPKELNEPGAASDDSICSDENQDILEACIASAMPSKTHKSKDSINQRTRALGPRLAAEGAPAAENKRKSSPAVGVATRVGPPPPPERKGSHLSHPCVAAAFGDLKLSSGVMTKDQFASQSGSSARGRDFGQDQPRSYRVEDTPLNFSAATSLSDLTVDDPDLRSGRVSASDSRDDHLESRGHRRGVGRNTRSFPASGTDTPLRYMTEDTPAVFSRNDSLSSLECEDASVATEPQYKGRYGQVSKFKYGETKNRSFCPFREPLNKLFLNKQVTSVKVDN